VTPLLLFYLHYPSSPPPHPLHYFSLYIPHISQKGLDSSVGPGQVVLRKLNRLRKIPKDLAFGSLRSARIVGGGIVGAGRNIKRGIRADNIKNVPHHIKNAPHHIKQEVHIYILLIFIYTFISYFHSQKEKEISFYFVNN
jgi:hypothetical protein